MTLNSEKIYQLAENSYLIEFSNLLDVTPIDLLSKNKNRAISEKRNLYYKLRHEVHGQSFAKIAEETDRSYSTVIRGIEYVNGLLNSNLEENHTNLLWNKVKDIQINHARDPTTIPKMFVQQRFNTNYQPKLKIKLMETITENQLEISQNKVIDEFAKRLEVTPMQIIERNTKSSISDIRHLYCALRYQCHGATYSDIASEIDRSPATVMYAVRRITDLLNMGDKKITALWRKVKDIPGYYQ